MIDREKVIDELFARAVELGPDQREALFIDESPRIGEDLVDEVKALLRDHVEAEAKGFLQQPLISAETDEPTHVLSVGQDFEGYKILSLIEEGGMGEVYLAQDKQLERKVAIKLIKSHLKTKEVLRRFHNERQILANLQHPNIAQLFEARATADGLPFFVMEYVEGKPIDKYAAEHELSITDRLKLFRTVCSAVSYAHQNLVIHRDIKPGNILVTEKGEPKLLDFGIAKLLHEADSEEQDVTATLFRVMTPEYASPEQVRGESVTTSSDVYSLAVLLYELLTGHRPYKLKRRTTEEITKAILEQEPEKPSAAIRMTAFRVPTSVGPLRRDKSPTEVGTLNTRNRKLLRGDLDNIILKALRKEPQRRYASVEQFSEDIRRHLEGLPVSARKATLSYRTSKFIQRNKIGVAAAAIILLTLVGGIITTAWQAHKARIESAKAQQRFNEVRKLAHSVLFDYQDAVTPLAGSTQLRQLMVKDSLAYLDSLAKDAGGDLSLQREIGTAYQRIGDVQGGGLTSARGGLLSSSNLGDTKGALESYGKAVVIRERLAALQPANVDVQQEWGTSITRLGELSLTLGRPAEAIEYFQKAQSIYEKLLAADPTNEVLRAKTGSFDFVIARALGIPGGANLGKGPEALVHLRKSLAVFEALSADYPKETKYRQGVGAHYSEIARVLLNDGKPSEALENYQKSLAMSETLAKENSTNAFYRDQLAISYGNVGRTQLVLGKRSEALDSARRAVEILESLVAADPNDAASSKDLGNNCRYLGEALAQNNDRIGARSSFEKSKKIFETLGAKDPTNALVSYSRSLTNLKLSEFLTDGGDPKGAVDEAHECIRIDEALISISPNNNTAKSTLAEAYSQLGKCDALLAARASTNKQQDEWREAKSYYQKSLDIYQDMKSKGTLSGADANNPDRLASDIAKCDAALEKVKTK